MQKVAGISEFEPLAKEIVYHTGEVFSRVFLPTIVFDEDKVRYHAKKLKSNLGEVI